MSINKSEYWQNEKRARIYFKQTSKPDYSIQLNKVFVDHIETFVPKHSKILDIGAGTGVVSLELASRGYNVTATDISKEMLSHIQRLNSDIMTVQGDIFKVVFSEKFNCVVSRWFIPHFRNWPALINHITDNFLADSGYLVFDMPQAEHISKSNESSYEISPEVFGYDHSDDASEAFFYAMASYEELKEIENNGQLEFITRIPHGIYKSNLILAKSLGEEKFKRFNEYVNKIGRESDGREFLYNIEKYITPYINSSLAHGSIVIFRKK